MAPSRRHDLDRDDGSDRTDRSPRGADAVDGEMMEDGGGESGSASSSSTVSASSASSHAGGRRTGARGGLAESLADVLSGELDADAAVDGEHWVLRWLRALDLQVLGACRADERLKPLFKFNASSGAAEDRFLAQISQHFEVSEVGMLTRYLCVPLVSVRVGKIDKQGDRLCPIAARGHLNLNMLPSSSMRLSYVGDDGSTERLALINNDLDFDVMIEEISADPSGRSFLLKLPGSRAIYYWCSEKSKFHGKELVTEMKDLLKRKPSLSVLTGISQSRLDSFATHLRTYLIECFSRAEANSTAARNDLVCHLTSQGIDSQASCMVSNFPRSHLMAAHSGKVHSSCQGNLSPRLSSFKDGNPKTSSYARSGSREKLKRHVDSCLNSLATNSEQTSMPIAHTRAICTSQFEDDDLRGAKHASLLPFCLPDIPSLPSPLISLNPTSMHSSSPLIIPTSKFSPYYCWCPPCPSSLQYPLPSLQQQSLPSESLPLSPLLLAAVPTVSALPSKQPIDVGELRGLTFPAVVPNPLFPVPFSVSSRTLSVSQQIPSFPPFMSDPIVHIPMIDVCSSGQGYLVTAGPAISSAISPLLPSIVNPLIPKTESLAEKSARETLQMLLSSPPIASSPQLMNVVPVVLNNVDKKLSCANECGHGDLAFASCALFDPGTPDVDAVERGPLVGMDPLEKAFLNREVKRSGPNDGGNFGDAEGP